MRPFASAHSMVSPEGILMSSCLVSPAAYQPLGKDWKFNEFKKSCASFSSGGALGKREADRKKTFKEITLPPRVASIEDNDRIWRCIIFPMPIYLRGWFHYCCWPQLWQRERNLIDHQVSVIYFLSLHSLSSLTTKLGKLYLPHSNQPPSRILVTVKFSLKIGCFPSALCELIWQVSFTEEQSQPRSGRAS